MFFGQTPEETRAIFFKTFQKYRQQEPMEPLENNLSQVIQMHPEYHHYLEKMAISETFHTLEDNPFLHMGLHMAVREQITLNQPDGIQKGFQSLLKAGFIAHEAEHQIMRCLLPCLKNQDETTYLNLLHALFTKTNVS